jgi:hypothetical protein
LDVCVFSGNLRCDGISDWLSHYQKTRHHHIQTAVSQFILSEKVLCIIAAHDDASDFEFKFKKLLFIDVIAGQVINATI